jgi:tetratricopeptide (TPR) repeat protein
MKKKSVSITAAKKKAAPAIPDGMEQMVREFVELLGNTDEPIPQSDWGALMKSLKAPSAFDRLSEEEADAKDEAQQFAFDAMEADSEEQARKLAKRALKLDPDCVDALVLINGLDARTPREMIAGLQKAVAAGERSLGEKFIQENEGDFWMLLETRPYMRAMAELAELLRGQGIDLDAIRLYEKMLELNPNDNQGVRDPLLGLYLKTGDAQATARLLKQYKLDASANFAWGRVLERFLADDHTGARKALKTARSANRFVELFLTGQKKLPKDMPEMYSMGSEEEAVLSVINLGGAWDVHQEAASWLFGELGMNSLKAPRSKSASKKLQAPKKNV